MQRRYHRWRWPGGVLLAVLIVCSVWVHVRVRKEGAWGSSADATLPPAGTERGLGFQFTYKQFCDEILNSGGWIGEPLLSCEETTKVVATCGKGHEDSWQWSSDAANCGAQRMGKKSMEETLKGKWVSFVGDSVGRNIFAALLRLTASKDKQQVVYGHKDFEYVLPGSVRASFYWAPYAENATALFERWAGSEQKPDAIVLSVGLWHMLHVTSALGFGDHMRRMAEAAHDFMSSSHKGTRPTITLCSITEVYPPKLRAEDKRLKMTLQNVDAYNLALAESSLLVPRGLMYLLDVHHLTQGCGGQCTTDGVHYSNATYDAALQIWSNNLRILPSVKG